MDNIQNCDSYTIITNLQIELLLICSRDWMGKNETHSKPIRKLILLQA
jgi:hypothetical protein